LKKLLLRGFHVMELFPDVTVAQPFSWWDRFCSISHKFAKFKA
jgi:hypothetical protein